MAKFLLIYRGGEGDESKMSPEEMQQILGKWNAWIGEGFAKGWMVDPGDALYPAAKIVSPKKVVTDGPFAESKEIVGGYSVVLAETIDGAAEHAKGCPHLANGGSIEIRQLMGLAPPQ
jgi:hypothetical protein